MLFFSSRRRHTRCLSDWSSDVCSSDLCTDPYARWCGPYADHGVGSRAQRTELLKQIADAVDIPILTGEDIYLKENFIELCKAHAVDIIHPDLATSGGILETKTLDVGAVD